LKGFLVFKKISRWREAVLLIQNWWRFRERRVTEISETSELQEIMAEEKPIEIVTSFEATQQKQAWSSRLILHRSGSIKQKKQKNPHIVKTTELKFNKSKSPICGIV
jgi:hypothetical protein